MKKFMISISMLWLMVGSINAQSVNENYVKVFKAGVPLVNDITLVNDKSKVNETVNYYDGLGRGRQSIDRALSPSGNDVVKFNIPDGYGRNTITYLPYVSSEANGSMRPEPLSNQTIFYDELYDSKDAVTAFTQQVFEHSELARPLIQSSPEAAWQLATGKVVRKDHAVNASNEIQFYRYDAVSGSVKSCDEFYAPGTLTRTRTIDEDGNETNEFIDNDGRVVCKQVKVSSTVNASTYYLYDDFGSLQVVIQPEGAKALTDRTVRTSQGFVLDNWAFQYRYDGRRRMTHKKVPGAEWVYMVYDDRDRLVMTQDGEQRKTNTWKFTRYDALNRPVVTGLYSHSSFLDQAGMSALIDTSNLYETFIGGSDFFGYTNVVMPPDRFTGTFEPLTITYYDDYSFLNNDPYFKYRWTSLKGQYQFTPPGRDPFPRVAGYVTGTWIRVLGKDRQWLRTVNYYDDKYRIIQTITDNHKRGQDILTNVYDFTGKVLANRTESVDHHLVWGDSHPTVQRQEDRVRNTGPNNTFSPWASSIQQVGSNSDGWVEFTCSSVTTAATTRIFGFSTSSTALNVGYGVRQDIINSSSTVRAYENNVAKGATVAVQGGDVIRIERKNMSMLYSKNGVAFYTTTLASRPALFAQTYLNQANAELFNPRISIAGPTKSIERHFEYDHAGRLLKTWHRADGADSVLLVKNEYNELGQLIDKKLHSIDNVHFRQSLDYRYNIRGWITSIIWSTTCGRR